MSLSNCAHQPLPVDSYCQVYNKIVVEKGDGDIKAKPAVKKRLLANELTYGQCPKDKE